MKNIKQGKFVFQQETFLSHRSDWWKALQENLVVKVMIFNNISFPFSQQEKQPVRREWNDSFSPLSSFLPIIMVAEYAEAGLVGQTRITNGKKYRNSLHIGGRLKSFWKHSCCGHPKIQQPKLFDWIGRFPTNLWDRNKKWSSSNHAKVQSFGCQFNTVQLLNLILRQNYEQTILLA